MAATRTHGRGQPSMAARGTHGRRRNRRLRRRGDEGAAKDGCEGDAGYFLSWAAKKEARMVPEMLW